GPIHDRLVGPFEIEGVDEGFPQAPVLELLPPGVEEPALRARGRVVANDVALDAPVPHRRKVIARRPDARGELLAEQIAPAGEAFEGDIAVAVELVPDDVEIVGPARNRQIGAPPVLDTVILDKAPGIEPSDLVRTAAERRLERGLI